jgi:glycosyltransferase involved in cell wall biosynthesis
VNKQDFKKQQVMVNAFKHMIDSGLKAWNFVVITSIRDTSNEQFQAMISSARGYPIEFLINKNNRELWEFYNKAKIYWHASGYGEDLEKYPHFAEHFGISTVEAMGAGVVPIVINAGGQKEIIVDGENGLLWNTLEELQEKTRQLIHDKAGWEKMSKNARQRAQDFSKERFCKAVYELLNY